MGSLDSMIDSKAGAMRTTDKETFENLSQCSRRKGESRLFPEVVVGL